MAVAKIPGALHTRSRDRTEDDEKVCTVLPIHFTCTYNMPNSEHTHVHTAYIHLMYIKPLSLSHTHTHPQCISEVEGVVRGAPPSSLQPALLANLTAAYDLESSSAHSKKLSFLPLLGQHVGEGFPLNSLGLR